MSAARFILSLGLLATCVLFRQTLEADPVKHVLIQLPFLAVSGWLFMTGVEGWRKFRIAESAANAFLLVGVFAILFWMLPRFIDATLVDPVAEFAKFISIPVFVGGSLAIGWANSNPFLRGFLKVNAISMLSATSSGLVSPFSLQRSGWASPGQFLSLRRRKMNKFSPNPQSRRPSHDPRRIDNRFQRTIRRKN